MLDLTTVAFESAFLIDRKRTKGVFDFELEVVVVDVVDVVGVAFLVLLSLLLLLLLNNNNLSNNNNIRNLLNLSLLTLVVGAAVVCSIPCLIRVIPTHKEEGVVEGMDFIMAIINNNG